MRYFTPERYLAFQQTDRAAMDAADAAWESAVEQYDAYLQTIRPGLPEPVRLLLEGYYLHDGRVLGMGRRDNQFLIALQLDVPPNDLLLITYTLTAEPEISRTAFPADGPSDRAEWLYEEIEQFGDGGGRSFVHSFLLSNGWEVRLPFREVTLTTASSLLPPPFSAVAITANGASSRDRYAGRAAAGR